MRLRTILYVLALATSLWLVRWIISGDSVWRYAFIPWNVFLAAIPLLVEPLFKFSKQYGLKLRRLGQALLGAIWLLFLPNSFYVLTDFMHLNANVLVNNRGDGNHMAHLYPRGDGMFVYDSLLLLVATVASVYFGALALLHCYAWLRRQYSQAISGAVLGMIMFLVTIGVYIGRFGRWNSWDGLLQPWRVAADFIHGLGAAYIRERFATILLTVMLLQLLSVWAVWRISGGTADQH